MAGTDLNTTPSSDAPPKRSLGVRLATWLGIALAVLVGVVLVAALLLRTEWGRSKVQDIAVAQVQNLLAEGGTVTVDRLDGGFLTGARLLGLEILQDGETVIRIDTARADYQLLTLLRKRLALGEVVISGVEVVAREDADSTWNFARVLKPAAEDTSASAFTVTLDEARITRGRVETRFYSATGDSVLTVDGLNATLSGFHFGPGRLEGTLDTLYATATPNAGGPVQLAMAGGFGDDQAMLRSFLLTSDRSDVRASGRIDYGGEDLTFDADLQASPLAFADVRAFAPVPLYGTPTIRLQANGTPQDILARLDAEFAEGGTVDLSGAFSGGSATGPVRYAAEGTVRDLDPGRLLGNPAFAGALSADLDLDLSGPSREALDGTLDVKVRPTTLGERTIERADLVGQFTGGQLQFTLGAAVPGARVFAEGTARPFADVPRYNVDGQVQDVDLARLLQNPEQPGRFAGTFAAEGRGFAPETAVATASVRLSEAQVGEIELDTLRLGVTLRDGTVGYDTEATFAGDGGLVAAEGVVRPFAEPLAYRVDDGRLEDFDLAAVTGDTTRTDLTGRFALSGSGAEAARLSLDLTASLRDSRYAAYRIDDANVAANLRGGRLAFDLDADLGAAGGLDAEGTAQPFEEPLAYEARGAVRNLDLGVIAQDTTQSSDLTGTFAVSGTGVDPQTLAADVRLDLRDARFRDQQITEGTVTGALRSGDLRLDVDAATPDGDLRLAASGRPFDETPTLRLSESTFRGLNLAAVTGNPALQTSLNGFVELELDGFDQQLATASGRIVLAESRVNGAALESGTVRFDNDRGYVEAGLDLDFETGGAAAQFTGRPFGETPSYDASGALDGLDVTALLGEVLPDSVDLRREATRLTLSFDVAGRGFDPATMTLDGSLVGGGSVVVGADLDSLRTDFGLAGGVVQVDGLLLRSSFADATGAGQIALPDYASAPTDFAFEAEVKDTTPLNAFLAEPVTLEQGRVEGRATGAPGDLFADVRVEAQQFAYGEIRASTLDLILNGEVAGAAADTSALGGVRGTARIDFGFLSLPSIDIEGGDIDVTYDGEELTAQGELGVDRRRDLAFRLRTDLNPNERNVVLETFTFNVDGEPWQLLQEATISYGSRTRFRNLLLYSGDQQIAVDGVVDLEGEQNLVLTVDQLAIDAVTDLVGYDGVGGTLSTTLVLAGPAARPTINGSVQIDSLVSGGETVGSLATEIAYDDFRLTLGALLTHVSGQTLRAEGFLPLGFRLSPAEGEAARVSEAAAGDVDFVVRADSFPVSWAQPFLPPETFTEVGGTLAADLTVTGTQADPVLGGEARLSDGRLGLLALGRTVQAVEIPLVFDGNMVRIRGARAGARRNGALEAEGTITLPKLSLGELAIAIEMDGFNVIETPTYDALRLTTRDLPLLFEGTTDFPRLTGAITLESGDIYLTEELTGPDLEEVELSEAELQRIEATFGVRATEADTARSVFVQNLELDLDLEIDRNVWLRSNTNPEFDIEFFGTLLVQKEPGGENQLFRTIEVNRGSVVSLGRKFDLRRGVLTFNGPVSETQIDLEAAYEVPARSGPGTEATILLTFAGRLGEEGEQAEDGLALTFSAEPAMENTDILSYIATGRPAGEAFGGGGDGGLGGAALGAGIGQLSGIVEGLAANSGLALDVIEINQRPDGAIVATFGSYVTNRTFASLSPVIKPSPTDDGETESRFEATLEYQLLDWLILQLERRNQGGDGGSALIEFSY
ncbi:MAG: translocation/assembly module TamB domain-containing protein [Bacteroidota bacterium]